MNPHSHCNFPSTKLSPDAKALAAEAITAHGTLGATTLKVKTAPTTTQLTGGKSLQEVHPGFLNARRLQEMVKKARTTAHPEGEEWIGLCNQREKDRQLPFEKQYIQACHAEGDIQLCIAMYPAQARIFHLADYLVIDYTFKRIYGDLNEWEIVVWHPSHNERTTVGRFLCNKQNREAFRLLWRKLFETVDRLTGRPLHYAVIHKSGTLKGHCLDAEAAQVQGLADELVFQVKTADPADLALTVDWQSMTNDKLGNYLAQLVTKLCTAHYNRDVDAIAGASDEDKRIIKNFPYLKTEHNVKDFYIWCLDHHVPGVLNWYKNKVPYPWYFSGYNQNVSPMPYEHWIAVPWHTNEAESAHPLSNRLGGTQLTALAAIEQSRKMDGDVMRAFSARDSQAIPSKKTLIGRLSHNTNRRISTLKKVEEKQARNTELQQLETERAQNQERNKMINAAIKSLKADAKNGKKGKSASAGSSTPSTSARRAPPSLMDSPSVDSPSVVPTLPGNRPCPDLPANFSSYTPAFQSPNTAFAFLSPPYTPSATTDALSEARPGATSSPSQSRNALYHTDFTLSDDFDITFS
ncbi:hypothetical protein M407DRAFT_223087 [Tulasnella calospora MUT 4182]|uniref:MULE transposase domain-containing protein n=1 Tax=Tulasnella calospora MUT 4182 TaxID=1051891 RepID=A0A0C3Q6J8_9AGAM|nr:hypothetical protein M407DRAFT_223087 [Tulasnella calospora MUT 4182]